MNSGWIKALKKELKTIIYPEQQRTSKAKGNSGINYIIKQYQAGPR
jgi:hypothetical protein